MIASAIELTATEFDTVWHELGLGQVPYPLTMPRTEATTRQRVATAERVRRALGERGLTYEASDSDLARFLGVLAEGEVSVDAVGQLGGPLRGLTAAVRGLGVTATISQNTVWLMEVWPELIVESIVDIVPPEWPGPGAARVVPIISLAAVMAGRVGSGEFGVTVAGPGGTRRRADQPVRWFDTRDGRYLLARQGDWVSVTPADNQRIAHRIREVIGALTTRAR
ncbi:MAG TPA: ESX secretion-associated protein EspG [Actinophytocola sp.]|uniref:ESX secretion-associated protein EspG n=1 Tax=Actinophytocola sp. TaxID=1872138 RepID=UPI002DDD6C07|nr:ESX secretion-associated protein EspG [Actinophytocola sp.]HEV2784020.1 ESX secretion-associated protein EspG [Actinophytocola sp.]